MKLLLHYGLLLLGLCLAGEVAHAQLATTFYNLTGIETKVLPNAIQITVRADGAVRFGLDLSEVADTQAGNAPKATSAFRLRFNGARSKLASFVPIGKYPLDAIAVSPGREPLQSPFYASQTDPQTDLTFRFDVPVILRAFRPNSQNVLGYGSYLNPLEASIERGEDASTVILTIVPDRVDVRPTLVEKEISPARLNVQHKPNETWKISASNAPLGELLSEVTRHSSTPLVADATTSDVRVSLYLADAKLPELLNALEIGYDLVASPRDADEGGGFRLSRGVPENPESPSHFEHVSLNHLAPERARLLFPDFLLPFLRVDKENNALLVSGSKRLIERLRHDLSELDVPPPQVKIEATAWEITGTRDANSALRVLSTFSNNGDTTTAALDTATGQYSFRVDEREARQFSTTVEALATQGRARLIANPFLIVASGERSTLFLGQTRFVPVLQNQNGGQNIQALQLAIGYALNVRPLVGADDSILLEVNPRLSTVDDTEERTGLPTLGVRETNGVLRLQSGDSVLVGGLNSKLEFNSRRGSILNSRRDERSTSTLLIMVKASIVATGATANVTTAIGTTESSTGAHTNR